MDPKEDRRFPGRPTSSYDQANRIALQTLGRLQRFFSPTGLGASNHLNELLRVILEVKPNLNVGPINKAQSTQEFLAAFFGVINREILLPSGFAASGMINVRQDSSFSVIRFDAADVKVLARDPGIRFASAEFLVLDAQGNLHPSNSSIFSQPLSDLALIDFNKATESGKSYFEFISQLPFPMTKTFVAHVLHGLKDGAAGYGEHVATTRAFADVIRSVKHSQVAARAVGRDPLNVTIGAIAHTMLRPDSVLRRGLNAENFDLDEHVETSVLAAEIATCLGGVLDAHMACRETKQRGIALLLFFDLLTEIELFAVEAQQADLNDPQFQFARAKMEVARHLWKGIQELGFATLEEVIRKLHGSTDRMGEQAKLLNALYERDFVRDPFLR